MATRESSWNCTKTAPVTSMMTAISCLGASFLPTRKRMSPAVKNVFDCESTCRRRSHATVSCGELRCAAVCCAAAVLAVVTRLVGDGADGGEGVEVEEVVERVAQRDPHVAEGLAHRLSEDGQNLLSAASDGRDSTKDQRKLHHLGHAAARARVQAVSGRGAGRGAGSGAPQLTWPRC